MASYCDNCGCKVYSGACVNCHEAVYIQDQYIDLEMEVPDSILKEVEGHQAEIIKNQEKGK